MTACARLWPHGEGVVWSEPRREAFSVLLGRRDRGGSPLGLSNDSNSQDLAKGLSRKARGTKGLTSRGRKILRSAAVIVEKGAPRGCLTFCTVTLPPHVMGEFSPREHWPEIVRRFTQSLRERLSRRGLPSELFGCSEVQPKRAASCEGVPLHLHLCFQGRHRRSTWEVSTRWVERSWRMAVEGVLGTTGSVSAGAWKASTQLVQVRKSVGRYLGKYLGKGAAAIATYGAEGLPPDLTPPSWYLCTRSLMKKITDATLSGSFLADWLEQLVMERNPLISYWARHQIIDSAGCCCKSFLYVVLKDPPADILDYN